MRCEILKEVSVEGLALERFTYLVYRKDKHPREVLSRFLDLMRRRRAQAPKAAEFKDERFPLGHSDRTLPFRMTQSEGGSCGNASDISSK